MSEDHSASLGISSAVSGVVLTEAVLNAPIELVAVKWEGKLHCAYLNDHRIAGGKPWGGGDTAKAWKTSLREVIRAFPELQRALGFNYLGQSIASADTSERIVPAREDQP